MNKPDKSPEIFKELAKEIGSKASYVRRLLVGYQVFELIQSRKFYDIAGLEEENFDLSLITDALTMQPAIAEYVGINSDTPLPFDELKHDKLKEVTEWLYAKLPNGRTRVGESRNLRTLSRVIKNSDAWYPSLHFKPVHSGLPVYSIRITRDYRAVGILQNEKIIWFWVGSHSDYDKLLNSLKAHKQTGR